MREGSKKCEKLEQILKGMKSAVLELNCSEEDIKLMKISLMQVGYEVSLVMKDEKEEFYHVHIIKSFAYEND